MSTAGGAWSDIVDETMAGISRERMLTKKLSQRVAGSVASYNRRTPYADPREKARAFLENIDWHLPEDLAELGSAARAFPSLVSDSVAALLDPTLDFVAAYLAICGYTLGSAGSRWRQPGRPWKKVEVLAGLLQRAVTATNETFALLERGFSDGAEARMRTVVELAVVAKLIQRNKTEIAQRFEASHHVEMWRRKNDGHLRGLSEDTSRTIDQQYERVIRRFGTSMSQPYGWASPAFENRRVTYADISRVYGDVESNSRFSNASHHVHASHSGTFEGRRRGLGGDLSPRPKTPRFLFACVRMHGQPAPMRRGLLKERCEFTAQCRGRVLDRVTRLHDKGSTTRDYARPSEG